MTTHAYQNPGTKTFIPEVWDSELLTQFDPLLVWASPLVTNRKYEGNISKQGDTVHVNSLLRPTVGDYTIADGMTSQRPETVDQLIHITEAKYIQVLTENVEQLQAAGSLSEPINREMIRGLAREADTFVSGIVAAGATAASKVTATAGQEPQALFTAVLDLMLALDENDIPNDGSRYVVVSPKVKRHLIEHPSIANAAAYGTAGATAHGLVAALANFKVLSTTAMPKGVDIVAGHPDFATFASQFSGFRQGQSEKWRGDYLDNVHFYGGKIVRFPALDTKKPDKTFDETKPTKGIVKAAVEWSTPA